MQTNHAVPRGEYPRPQMVRENWMCLNGTWDFCIDNGLSGEERGFAKMDAFDGKIIVPFCPESKLSGVAHTDFMYGVWYTRSVNIPAQWLGGRRTILHIGACDYITKVFVNGEEVGSHRGGYSSFAFEITKFLQEGENRITIFAQDDTRSDSIPSGKQCSDYYSHGCSYTRTTGIWQTVWLENVPASYIETIKMTPDVAAGELMIELTTSQAQGKTVKVHASFNGKVVGETQRKIAWNSANFALKLDELYLWDIENPQLYDIVFTMDEDKVESYFGMREVVLKDNKTYLNGKCVFQRLILDQGFYPDGIYTAPTDEELINDIKRSQALGYNGARLHEKVFEARFLYHCDRLGYIVWGEYPNWGLDVSKESCYKAMLPEWLEIIKRDYNHPALIGWCPLNETQVDIDPEFVRYLYNVTKTYDPTRQFIDNSGWYHIDGCYDMLDVHDYCGVPEEFKATYLPLIEGKPAKYRKSWTKGVATDAESADICFVSEFGGARWVVDDTSGNNWGYGAQVKNVEEFIARYKGVVDALLDNPMISAFCYTQLTDVEQEQNGLYTYDRRCKFDAETIKAITSRKAACEE